MNGTENSKLDLRSVFGLTATVVIPAVDPNRDGVVMEVVAEPGAAVTMHRHPGQEETYEVMEGQLDVLFDGTWHSVMQGEVFRVPPDKVHSFRNPLQDPVRFLNTHKPALLFQDHLEMLDRLVQEGKITGIRDPRSLIYMSMSATKYRPDVSVKPPQAIVTAMSNLGRLLRFRLPEDDAPQ